MLTHIWGIHLTHPGEKDPRGKCFENCLDELLGQSNSSLCASSNPSRALGAPFWWRLLENTSIGHRGKIITIIQASFLLVAVLWCCQSKFGAEKTFSIVFLTRNLCAVHTSQQLLPFGVTDEPWHSDKRFTELWKRAERTLIKPTMLTDLFDEQLWGLFTACVGVKSPKLFAFKMLIFF